MANIEDLMLKREHFPVSVKEGNIEVIMPPYHPSMAQTGVYPNIGLKILNIAIFETINDLADIAENVPEIMSFLENLPKDSEGNIDAYVRDQKTITKYDDSLGISPFNFDPDGKELVIKNEGLVPGGFASKSYCLLQKPNGIMNNIISGTGKRIELASEIINEYELTVVDRGGQASLSIESKHRWDVPENENPIRKVFYKNFSIAYCNEVVRRKILQKDVATNVALPLHTEDSKE